MEIRPRQFRRIRVSLAIRLMCLATLIAIVAVSSHAQQLSQEWVNRVDGPVGPDIPYAQAADANLVAADANDNSYVTGIVCLQPPNPISCVQGELEIVKYDKSGKTAWTETVTAPGNYAVGTAVQVDASGNVYVAGWGLTGQTITETGGHVSNTVEFIVAKYNSGGTQQWIEYFNPPGGGATDDDSVLELNHLPLLAIDSQGNSYLSLYDGADEGGENNGPIYTVKYDSSGNQLWAAEFLSAKISSQGVSESTPSGLAVDSQGNVHLTGTMVFNAALPQVFTLAYDTNGNQLWDQIFDSGAGNGTYSGGIAVDASGNSYIGAEGAVFDNGQVYSPGAAYIIKYNPSGQQLWASQHITSGTYGNILAGITVDSLGNIYAAGAVETIARPLNVPNGPAPAYDFDTLKFDTNGNLLWEQRYRGNQYTAGTSPGISYSSPTGQGASALALDSQDNVYVTGWSSSSGNANGLDYATLEYDANGNQLGAATYNGPGNGNDLAVGIAVGSSDVFVTGYSLASGTSYGWATIEYAQAAASSLNIAPASLTFASENVGSTSPAQTATVTNNGSAALNITAAPAISGTNADDFAIASGTTCTNGASLPANGSCLINVTFKPSVTGSETATLTITDSDSSSPQTIMLTGTGTAAPAPAVSFSANGLTFASQPEGTTSGAQTVTLTNTGNAALNISSVSITGSNASEFAKTNVTCESSLAANASCTISVDFSPSATGTQTATVSVADNAPSSPQTVTLTGTGEAAAAPAVGLMPTSLTFATPQLVGTTSTPQSITLTNTGNATLTISGITVSGSDAKEFAVGTLTCGQSLAANANCKIPISFTPAGAGSRTATLTITDNAAQTTQNVSLTGAGSDFALSSANTSATVNAGQTATYTVTASPTAFTGAVAFTCSGAPVGAMCAVNPASVNLAGSTPAQVTVTVTTTAASGGFPGVPSNSQRMLWMSGLLTILVGLLGLSATKSYRIKPSLVLMLLLLIASLGCGSTSKPSTGSGTNPPSNPTNPTNPTNPGASGTPAGTSTITVTGTSGPTVRTLPLTLTVN